MKTLIILFTVTSLNAYAGTTDCASQDAKLSYRLDLTDGGAPRGPIENLTYDGNTLINISPFGGSNIKIANVSLSEAVWESQPTVKSDYATTKSVKNILVESLEDGSKIVDDLVFCQEVRYVGRPRP